GFFVLASLVSCLIQRFAVGGLPRPLGGIQFSFSGGNSRWNLRFSSQGLGQFLFSLCRVVIQIVFSGVIHLLCGVDSGRARGILREGGKQRLPLRTRSR